MVKVFYENWAKHDARSGTLKQIKISLDSGKELLLNGNTETHLSDIVERNFPLYLKADQTSMQCSKKHKNYKKLKQVAKETFINYLKELRFLLNVKEDVTDYGELCRIAFKDKELAYNNLNNQLNYTDRAIKIIEEDPSILKIPIGKRIIVKALRKGFTHTKKEFIESLNNTYEEK